MSLELQAAEAATIDALWASWSSASDSELEATFKVPDYTAFLNIIKYLRSLGLQEEPQPSKLNIMVEGGLRFTLVGEGVIEAYCNDNTLKGKPFHVIIKEKKASVAGGLSEVDLKEYGVRIKVRREHPLDHDDPRIFDALSRWSMLPKSFRYIKRFSFTSLHHKGIVFDASFVRENMKDKRGNYIQSTTFNGANISRQAVHHEMEVEALGGASKKSLMVGIACVLRGLQKCHVLTRESVRQQVLALMAGQTGSAASGFPGTQPVTLRKEHMGIEAEADTPNIRLGDYNVTDKADGLRCLLVVAKNGKVFLVDRNLNVYGTDRRLDDSLTAEWAGAVLDGEWVTQNAHNEPMSKYFAFDIFNGKNGEDVSVRPFLVRSETAVSRLAAMTEAIAILSNSNKTVAGIPKQHSLSIHMKTFLTPADTSDFTGIFKESASVLDRLAVDPPYHTDGLIFTPNASPLPKNVNTWNQQFKWKPASMNSVDFLVVTESERGLDGKSTGVELVRTKLREDTNQMVRFKTLRLFVGSSIDPAFVDPRETVLNKKPYPTGPTRAAEYRPVEFSPSPPDPMASVCYVAINAGATDAAGAAPAARLVDVGNDTIYCDETHDPIASRTIVEMVYDPHKPAGWRWIPLRVRWDKTELFSRKKIGGTMNADRVANDVWTSIHDPITETMIRTGALTEGTGAVEGTAAGAVAYYQRKASQRDLYKVRGLADFHNQYIKRDILLTRSLFPKAAVLDMSVGQAGDIHKWVNSKVGWVLGCDIALTGLTDNKNGAYSRYLTLLSKSKIPVPRMLFVQADSALRYTDGSAGQTQLDKNILRTLWNNGSDGEGVPSYVQDMKGMAAGGFDVATCMFALHYFFKDRASVDGFLHNIADTLKVGGFFVGCCFDGDSVAGLLSDLPVGGVKRGNEDGVDIWSITKQYEDRVLPPNDDGLGKAIDVNFISIGETYTEYLVSWSYLVSRMAEIGMELLNGEELSAMGLRNSTNLFSESYTMAKDTGRNYPMSAAVSTFSFLNRWFIFRRRTTMSNQSSPVVREVVTVVKPVAAPVPVDTVEEVVVTEPTEVVVDEVREEPIVENTIAEPKEEVPVEEVATDVLAPPPPAEPATGPTYMFYHKSGAKDEIRVGNKYWRRYISTYAPFVFKDPKNPSITYSSLEAALGAAKYQYGTDKPELGAQKFSTVSDIHQGILAKRSAENTHERTEELTIEEGDAMRDAQKPAAIRKLAKWDQAKWDASKEGVINEFVRQRYEGDAHFRDILNAVKTQKAKLAYFMAGGPNELSGKVDGETITGDNMYGRALMRAVGLMY